MIYRNRNATLINLRYTYVRSDLKYLIARVNIIIKIIKIWVVWLK